MAGCRAARCAILPRRVAERRGFGCITQAAGGRPTIQSGRGARPVIAAGASPLCVTGRAGEGRDGSVVMGNASRNTGRRVHGLLKAPAAAVAAALGCAAGGCGFFGGGRQPAVITSNDPASKIPAIKKAVDARETQTARQLVKSLESEDPAVRFYSIRGLQDMTGETFGYTWYVEEPHRRGPVEKWKHWLDGNGGTLAGSGQEGGAGND